MEFEAIFALAHVVQGEFLDPVGQPGIDVQLAIWSIGLEADARLQKRKAGSGRPCLRNVRSLILHRESRGRSRQSGELLWHSVLHKVDCGAAHVAREATGFREKAIAPQAERDQPVVIRPYDR
ncbi:hypothetical protein NKH60_02585 [Mesorhizobium sp. M1006]|uniref:hypothetical protein n=1 Tax=Mesorhizobium sp. M1006 TaxID=2957048 RepID=UPI0033395F08